MPLIKPKPDEKKDDFIERCIIDPTNKKEFPAAGQRIAYCNDVWDKSKKFTDEKLETKDIKGVEIFATGIHNGDTYTDKDLDGMVNAFEKTKGEVKPFLKLGHSNKQHLMNSDEMPAVGWIESLRKVGSKLVADFSKVPKKIYDLIETGAYRRVSSEIFWNATFKGTKHPYILKAVALLGGATPAVQNLKDVVSLYDFDLSKMPNVETRLYEVNFTEDKMEKELEAKRAELAEANKKLTEKDVQIKELSEKNEKLTKEFTDLKKNSEELNEKVIKAETEKNHAEINTKLDKLIEDGNILPAQRENLFTLISNMDNTKKYSDGKEDKSPVELFFTTLESAKADTPNTEQETEAGKSQDAIAEAKAYAEKHKVSYKEALIEVSK